MGFYPRPFSLLIKILHLQKTIDTTETHLEAATDALLQLCGRLDRKPVPGFSRAALGENGVQRGQGRGRVAHGFF